MNGILNKIGGLPMKDCVKTAESYDESILGNLKRKQLRLKSQLDDINAAIKALEETPGLLNTLDLLNKALRG